MCTKPDIPDPQKFQAAKAPVFPSSTGTGKPNVGRRSTLLAGSNQTMPQGPKKTLLGA